MLHQAQIIVALPLLDYLAVRDAVYGDALELYLFAGGRAKLLYLALVGTAYGVACDDAVPLRDHVLEGCVQVREGGLLHGDELPGFLEAVDVLIGLVPYQIAGVDLVEDVQVLQEFPGTPRQGLVVFRHRGLLLS